ncbi:AAA family ATPase [Streptomyces sp. NPDC001139]
MNAPPLSRTSPDRGQVIVVTGPPGAGKSTVAHLLASRLTPSVHLHNDDFWHYIKQGWIAPYLPEAHRQNEVVLRALVSASFGYADGGYQVICDGVIGPWFIDLFRETAQERHLPLSYVILRPDQQTTLERATSRADDALTDPEPIRSLHGQFSDLGAFEAHVLDSSSLSAEATANCILQGVTAGAYLLNRSDSTTDTDTSNRTS